MFDTPYIIPVVAIIAWAVVAITRARHGQLGRNAELDTAKASPLVKKIVHDAMAERDEQIGNLRERVRILEKIVTDTHKSHHLSEEIEKLRDERTGAG